jgi:DNA-binding PadR family transcriptional regulator
MPIKTDNIADLTRRSDRKVLELDEPPLSHLQAIIAKKLDELGEVAFGYNVLEKLSREFGVWIDSSQVYTNIRKLNIDKDFIEHVTTRPVAGGGPAVKIYRLTTAGREALRSTAAHYRAVAEFLERRAPSDPVPSKGWEKSDGARRGRKKTSHA